MDNLVSMTLSICHVRHRFISYIFSIESSAFIQSIQSNRQLRMHWQRFKLKNLSAKPLPLCEFFGRPQMHWPTHRGSTCEIIRSSRQAIQIIYVALAQTPGGVTKGKKLPAKSIQDSTIRCGLSGLQCEPLLPSRRLTHDLASYTCIKQ